MKYNFEASLKQVLAHEGGFVNHPKDPGGATNMGITLETLAAHRGKKVDAEFRKLIETMQPFRDHWIENVKGIQVAEAAEIYRAKYWNVVRGDELPSGVDYCVFDCAVNSGPARAIRFLQSVLGVETDGFIGNKTMQRAWAVNPTDLIARYTLARGDFLASLVSYKTFGKGWDKRIKGVDKAAKEMAQSIYVEPASTIKPATRKPVPQVPLLAAAMAAFAKAMDALSGGKK